MSPGPSSGTCSLPSPPVPSCPHHSPGVGRGGPGGWQPCDSGAWGLSPPRGTFATDACGLAVSSGLRCPLRVAWTTRFLPCSPSCGELWSVTEQPQHWASPRVTQGIRACRGRGVRPPGSRCPLTLSEPGQRGPPRWSQTLAQWHLVRSAEADPVSTTAVGLRPELEPAAEGSLGVWHGLCRVACGPWPQSSRPEH